MGVSDRMLASGCVAHLAAIHGEVIEVLSGPDAGKFFTAVRENESDLVLADDFGPGPDPRAHRIIRFADDAVPRLASQCQIRTADGKVWKLVAAPQSGYLTTDFELLEIVPGKDT